MLRRFLIIHGDKDGIVPVQQSLRLDDALRKAGVDSTLDIIAGEGHGLLLNSQTMAHICDFFKRTLDQ